MNISDQFRLQLLKVYPNDLFRMIFPLFLSPCRVGLAPQCGSLVAENLLSWHDLVRRLMDIHVTDRPDTFKWSLNHNGQFSVKSMYQAFLDTNVVSEQ
jgi:hypothetical protein